MTLAIGMARWPAENSCAIAEQLGMKRWIDRLIAEYSLDTRAKIAIAAALLGAPPLLILDESFSTASIRLPPSR